jgi:mRNA-degrading endonuclease toxin of MazEF toxin-antitoxin module
MQRGEIWRIRLANSGGHSQAGERPTVIVKHNSATSKLPTILQVPFTSKLTTQRFP